MTNRLLPNRSNTRFARLGHSLRKRHVTMIAGGGGAATCVGAGLANLLKHWKK